MATTLRTVLFCGLLLLLLFPVMFAAPVHVFAQYGCPAISGGYDPEIIARENSSDVFVFWNYFYGCGQRVLFFNKSMDDGNTFGSPVVIADSNMTGSAPAAFAPSDSSNLYVAWFKDNAQPSPTLFFKKSTDNGATFGDAVRIDTNGTIQGSIVGTFASPRINNNNDDNIGVTWSGFSANNGTGEVFLSKSTDGGRSFDQPVLLGKSTTDSQPVPRMVQAGSEAYVLWSSGGDNGRHFVTKIDMADDRGQFSVGSVASLGNIGASVIAASGNNVYIASTNVVSNGGSSEGVGGVSILLLRSNDGGRSFGKPATALATYNNTDSNHINSLALDASKNFVYLTWYNFHSSQIGAEINVIASSDYGNTFGNVQKINSGNSSPSEPVLTSASGDRYYISWQNSDSVNNAGYQKLYFTSSSDGGNTFGKTLDLTGDAGISNPKQAITADDDSDHVYVAWLDFGFKDGNYIMFTKNTDSGNDHFSNAIDLDKDSQTIITKTAGTPASPSPEFSSSFASIAILAGTVGAIILAARIGRVRLKRR